MTVPRLPKAKDLRGSVPDFTRGKKTEDYLRELRGEARTGDNPVATPAAGMRQQAEELLALADGLETKLLYPISKAAAEALRWAHSEIERLNFDLANREGAYVVDRVLKARISELEAEIERLREALAAGIVGNYSPGPLAGDEGAP